VNVEGRAKFLFWEYINSNFFAVHVTQTCWLEYHRNINLRCKHRYYDPTTVIEFIDPVFAKTSPNARFRSLKTRVLGLLSLNWVYKFGHMIQIEARIDSTGRIYTIHAITQLGLELRSVYGLETVQ
jgi:hypothetical protein